MAVGTVATLYRQAGYCTVIPPTMYIFSNHGEESWPVESVADEVDRFPLAQVACSGVVMVVADDLQA